MRHWTKPMLSAHASSWLFSLRRWSMRLRCLIVIVKLMNCRYIRNMKTSKSNRNRTKPDVKESAAKRKKAVPDFKAVPSIKELLLGGPKFDLIVPQRRRWKRRP